MNEIRVAKLYPDAVLPTRKNPSDAGMDLYAYSEKWREGYSIYIGSHQMAVINTGITIEIPKNYVGLIFPKSRNWHLIGGGVVDSDYQGEILVKVANINYEPLRIFPGEAIAQLVIVPVFTPEIIETTLEEIHEVKTFRGKSGGIVEQVAGFKSNVESIPNIPDSHIVERTDKTYIYETTWSGAGYTPRPTIEKWD